MYKILAKTLILGKRVVYLPSCHSTNESARELARSSNFIEGTIVITNEQVAGRGQMGNRWESEQGQNLTFSILLKPMFVQLNHQFRLNICISLGLVDYLNSLSNVFQVKWPNDLYCKNNKLAGILIQNSISRDALEQSIIGIGLNVNQLHFSIPRAISMRSILGKTMVLPTVLEDLCCSVEKRYLQLKRGEYDQMKKDYLRSLLGYGQERQFDDGAIFNGVIRDVMDDGRIVIDHKNKLRSYDFKEIQFLFD
ncbi:MAG: biotin--[acetyl-CoA-carboxylase] ligase [Bacteroidota bacterium]